MSAYRDLFKGDGDEQASRTVAVAAIAKDFPLVSEVLAGIPKNGKEEAVPPGTITFYLDSGKCCAIIKPKDGDYLGFVPIENLNAPWDSLESAISGGLVSWKRRDKRTPAF
jgi:hypothetical protein